MGKQTRKEEKEIGFCNKSRKEDLFLLFFCFVKWVKSMIYKIDFTFFKKRLFKSVVKVKKMHTFAARIQRNVWLARELKGLKEELLKKIF